MRTAFTELVGCELPVQQAPVGYPAAAAIVADLVSRLGDQPR